MAQGLEVSTCDSSALPFLAHHEADIVVGSTWGAQQLTHGGKKCREEAEGKIKPTNVQSHGPTFSGRTHSR